MVHFAPMTFAMPYISGRCRVAVLQSWIGEPNIGHQHLVKMPNQPRNRIDCVMAPTDTTSNPRDPQRS